ncbi:MAG: rRNA maturation RNase YbeY [Candidatus Omnitrophica bacterium]|nr:rRNA maturation RNase YbeY [Candidatus Omnitrophota bacterium]
MKITIINLQNKVPVNSREVIKTVQNVLSSEGIRKKGEITVSFVNDKKIRELNLKYLGKNRPTDVIAFDVTEPKSPAKLFADIVISADRAIDNAGVFKTNALSELYLYIIHGVLHILGYDDHAKKDKLIMRKKEAQLLEKCLYIKPKY